MNRSLNHLSSPAMKEKHFRQLAQILSLLILLTLSASHSSVQAQALCIPPLRTDGPIQDAPNWFDSIPPQPSFSRRITDPRWGPALSHAYGEGTDGLADFRAINDGQFIYLSWRVEVDPTLDNNLDDLHVIFGSSTGTPSATDPDVRIKIVPFSSSAVPLEASATGVIIQVATRTSPTGSFTPLGSVPTWLTNTVRVWLVNTAPFSWAINMRVKRINPATESVPADGILIDSATNDFKMWYELRMRTTVAPTPSCPAPCIMTTPYAFPRDSIITGSGTTVVFPPSTAWGDFHMKTSAADTAACADVGVSLVTNMIGTTNSPASQINVSASGSTTNTLFARPLNNTGTTIPTGALRATYSIANWGTLPNRQDVADPSQLWRVIPGSEGGIPNDTPIPDGSATGTFAAATDFDFNWIVQDVGGANPFPFKTKLLCQPPLNPAASPSECLTQHQCMMVELSTGLPITFINKSAFRNMDYNVMASRFERWAEVSVAGLGPSAAGGPNRDVYLYVQTLNMPRVVSDKQNVNVRHTTAVNTRPGNDTPERVMAETEPTYRVYAWHDTGLRTSAEGINEIIVRPQTSFGYFMRHDGPLTGWRYSLEGAEEIGPDFYKIAVPNNGNVRVKTVIEALERGGGSDFKRWGLSLHAGVSIPHGNFSNVFNPGPNFAVDLEYRFHPLFSIEGIYGFHRFNGATIGGFTFSDVNLHQISVNGKVYANTSPVRPFFNFGGGAYHVTPSTHGGLNVGGGLQFDVTPNFAVEGSYNFHNIFTSGSSTRFSTVQAGVRFRF